MKAHIRFVALAALVSIAMLSACPVALAGIASISTTNVRTPVSAIGPTTVTVIWRVVRGANSPAGTISSPSGTLTINGTTVATVSRTLSRSAPASVSEITLIYTDTFTLSQANAYRAVKEGVPIIYNRTFTDTAGTIGGNPGVVATTALLTPSGPGSAQLTITRLSLTFDDRSRVKVLPKGSRLRAIAEINATGGGVITGQWEIADGATTAGAPVFRPLALVRQPTAGTRRLILTSPPLPTRFEGTNLVRLRLTDPDTLFDEPELQYYVTPESPLPDKQKPRLLLITAPSPGTPLTLTTRFAWQAIPGARFYKLEIFEAPPGPAELVADNRIAATVPVDPSPDIGATEGQPPLTGVVLPASLTEIRLQDYSLAHLPAGRRYLWMVKAVGEDGALLGVSPPREIYKP